jgi:nucleoside phosphorylase
LKALLAFALPFEAGRLSRCSPVPCFVAGACGARAVDALERKLRAGKLPDLVISAGLAGGLDMQLRTGDTVFADSGCRKTLFRLAARGISHPIVRVHSVETIVTRADDKNRLFGSGAGSVCDMETAGIAGVCERLHIAFLGLRVVSDDARTDIPIPSSLLLQPDPARLLAFLITHPMHIPGFCRMVSDAVRARAAMHRALHCIFANLDSV